MTMAEFIAYQEQSFDSYCKHLIKNEGIDARRELSRRVKREISFTDAVNKDLERLQHHDTYHLEKATIYADGRQITTEDITLGQALMQLPPKLREPILMLYFSDLTEEEIGDKLKLTPRTISNRKNKGLAMLREIIKELESNGS